MAKQRSPNHPATDLQSALEDVKVLYERERRGTVPVEVAVKAWGYKSPSGPSRSRLAALVHYGLASQDARGVTVSERALDLLMRSPGSEEYMAAVKAAIFEPTIFRELWDSGRFAGSPDALRHYLVVTKRFTEEAARRVADNLKSNLEFANLDNVVPVDLIAQAEEREGTSAEAGSSRQETGIPTARTSVNAPTVAQGPAKSTPLEFNMPLARNLSVSLAFTGRPPTSADIDRLKDYLDLVKGALEFGLDWDEPSSE